MICELFCFIAIGVWIEF